MELHRSVSHLQLEQRQKQQPQQDQMRDENELTTQTKETMEENETMEAEEIEEASSQLRQALISFAGATSAHGVGKLISPLWYVQILWLLLLAIAVGGLSYHLSTMVSKYMEEPVSTSISLQSVPYQYPGITICNQKFMSVSAMAYKQHRRSGSTANVQWVWTTKARTFFQTLGRLSNITSMIGIKYLLTKLENVSPKSAQYLSLFEQYAYDLASGIMVDTKGINHFGQFSLTPEKLLIRCRFGPFACTMKNFYQTILSDNPHCVTFNVTSMQEAYKLTPERTATYKLQLYMYTDSNPINTNNLIPQMRTASDPLFRMDSNGGADVYIHEPNTYPATGQLLQVSNGFQGNIGVSFSKNKLVNTKSKKCLNELPAQTVKYKFVELNGSSQIETFTYTQADCVIQKVQSFISDKCGCISNAYPVPIDQDAPFCRNITHAFIVEGNVTNATSAEYADLIERSFRSTRRVVFNDTITKALFKVMDQVNCEMVAVNEASQIASESCTRECWYSSYKSSLSLSTWPSKQSELLVEKLKQWLDSNEFYRNGKISLNLNFLRDTTRGLYDIVELVSTRGAQVATDNFVSLQIVADDKSGRSTQITEELSYQLPDLFSDLGGILGLYLGVSALTLCEVIELVLLLSYLIFYRPCGNGDKKRSTVKVLPVNSE